MNCMLVRLVFWLVTLAVFPIPANMIPRSFQIEVLESIQLADVPAFVTKSASSENLHALPATTSVPALPPGECERVEWTERVLAYLEKAEKKESDPWFRDDIRIAWITTKWVQSGVPEWAWHRNSPPYAAATYQVLQCLPDEVWPRIVAKRKEKLGLLYAQVWPEQVWGEASSPRKPVQSVKTAAGSNLAA